MPSGSKTEEMRPLSMFGARYTVSIDGVISDKLTGNILDQVKTSDGVFVTLPHFYNGIGENRELTIQAALLVALAYKTPNLLYLDALTLNVLFEDDNIFNIKPSNLILEFPLGGLEHPFWPGYRKIPGYTNYVINENGVVISLFDGGIKEPSMGTNGYPEISVTKDIGKSQAIGVHRLLALAFLPYQRTVRRDDVNHIDLDKTNYDLSNLEWTTRRMNLMHARMMSDKPVGRNIPVSFKNLHTDEIHDFESLATAAEFFGTRKSHIWTAISNRNIKTVFMQKYIVRYSDQPWPDITAADITTDKLSGGRAVLVKHVASGMVTRYDKAAQFVRDSQLSKKVITSNLAKGRQVLLQGLLFKYEDDKNPWMLF